MSVRIEATGNTISEALAGLGSNLEVVSTEELLVHLRQRYLEEDPIMVVKVVPFETSPRRKKKRKVA